LAGDPERTTVGRFDGLAAIILATVSLAVVRRSIGSEGFAKVGGDGTPPPFPKVSPAIASAVNPGFRSGGQ